MKKYFIEAFSRSTSSVPCPQCVIRMISMYTRAQVQVEAAAGDQLLASFSSSLTPTEVVFGGATGAEL